MANMNSVRRMGMHYLHKLNCEKIPKQLRDQGQKRIIDASLTLIRERAKLKGELLRSLGGVVASSCLLGVPLGHNSSYLQGPAFAPPHIREAMWDDSTNSTTEEGKDIKDPRVLTDVGDIPIQELRDCGVDDDSLFNIIGESVTTVMNEVTTTFTTYSTVVENVTLAFSSSREGRRRLFDDGSGKGGNDLEGVLRPLVLGGDHSISYPVVKALSKKLGGQVDILHLDAHPDIYDAFEGNKYSHASSFARIMEGGYARRLLQVGLRSINIEGREQGQRFGVEQFEMRTYSKDREYLENLTLGEGVKGVYVSVDVDVLDPGFASGVSHLEPGGLSFREVLNIIQNLKGNIVGADVVEYNAQRDTHHAMTAMVAAKLARELAAKMSK